MGVLDRQLAHTDEAAVAYGPAPAVAHPLRRAGGADMRLQAQIACDRWPSGQHEVPFELAGSRSYALGQAWEEIALGDVEPRRHR